MIESTPNNVSRLRNNLRCIPNHAGVYQWWFLESDAEKLLEPIQSVIDKNQIKKEIIHGQSYWLMYFGIANKNLNQRIKWHICQCHSVSSVKSGYLSTLRASISALLQKEQTQSEQDVNHILDRCYLAWQLDENPKETEKNVLTQGYFPLNIQGNKKINQKILKQLRKSFKK